MLLNQMIKSVRSVALACVVISASPICHALGAAALPGVERHDRRVLFLSQTDHPIKFFNKSWANYYKSGRFIWGRDTFNSRWIAPDNQGCEDNRGITVASWNIWTFIPGIKNYTDEREGGIGLMSPCADVLFYQEAFDYDWVLKDGPWASLQSRGYYTHTVWNHRLSAGHCNGADLYIGIIDNDCSGLVAFVRNGTRIIKSAYETFQTQRSWDAAKGKGFGVLLLEKNGRYYYVANTHFHFGEGRHLASERDGDSGVRRHNWAQATDLLARFLDTNYLQYPPSGLLLAGDFNGDFRGAGPLNTEGDKLLSNKDASGNTVQTSYKQSNIQPRHGFEGHHYYTPTVIVKNALQNCTPSCESYLPTRVGRALNSDDPRFGFGRFTNGFTRSEKTGSSFSQLDVRTNWNSANDFATKNSGNYFYDAVIPVADTVNNGKWGICTPESMHLSVAPVKWRGAGKIILPRRGWSDHYAVWMHYVPSDDCDGGAGVVVPAINLNHLL